jgi:hypothetical protein
MVARNKKRPVGRPPGRTYTVAILVRLTAKGLADIDRWARARGTTRAQAIRLLLAEGLKRKGK